MAGHDGPVIDNESDNIDKRLEENANDLEVISDLLL